MTAHSDVIRSEKTLRGAVIGTGALGRHHARIMGGLDGVQMVAACDPNETLGRAAAETAGCDYVPDYRDVLDQIDVASIVVPTGLHRRVALDCLEAGVDILVEKPLAACVDDGAAIVSAARQLGRTLAVGHIERFNPAFEAAVTTTGSPKYIRAERTSPYAFRSTDISVVHDLMIHDIELVLTLAGGGYEGRVEVDRVEAMGVSLCGGHSDTVQARLHLSTGCVADVVANRVSPTVSRSIQSWSAEGCVSIDLQARTVDVVGPGPRTLAGDLPLEAAGRGEAIDDLKAAMFAGDGFFTPRSLDVGEGDALTAELSDFVRAAASGTAPRVSGEQALAALGVADRVVESVALHRWNRTGTAGPNVLLPAKKAA